MSFCGCGLRVRFTRAQGALFSDVMILAIGFGACFCFLFWLMGGDLYYTNDRVWTWIMCLCVQTGDPLCKLGWDPGMGYEKRNELWRNLACGDCIQLCLLWLVLWSMFYVTLFSDLGWDSLRHRGWKWDGMVSCFRAGWTCFFMFQLFSFSPKPLVPGSSKSRLRTWLARLS